MRKRTRKKKKDKKNKYKHFRLYFSFSFDFFMTLHLKQVLGMKNLFSAVSFRFLTLPPPPPQFFLHNLISLIFVFSFLSFPFCIYYLMLLCTGKNCTRTLKMSGESLSIYPFNLCVLTETQTMMKEMQPFVRIFIEIKGLKKQCKIRIVFYLKSWQRSIVWFIFLFLSFFYMNV